MSTDERFATASAPPVPDFIPSQSEATRKANRTKRERWERLIATPEAWRVMEEYYDLRELADTLHCLDAETARALRARADAIEADFPKQFGVVRGYLKRFKANVWRRRFDAQEQHAQRERFTADDRAALAAWLAGHDERSQG